MELGAQLRGWLDAGYMTAEEAVEVEATLDMLIRYVRRGAIEESLAREIISDMASEKAAAWAARQSA